LIISKNYKNLYKREKIPGFWNVNRWVFLAVVFKAQISPDAVCG